MAIRLILTLSLLAFGGQAVFAQGLETTASPEDWEEINFEFDSDILSDGYPSLLRLSDLLANNPNYTVQLEGHTDFRGSDSYNVDLGRRRAETVRAFLLKYGASENQINVVTRGEEDPKVGNETDEGRFMNRRVIMTVRDGEGQVVSDGGVGDAIGGIEKLMAAQEECCNQILEKLNKLDEILDLLQGLQDENEQLRADVDALKNREPPPAPEPGPSTEDMARVMEETIERTKGDKYGSFNINVGPTISDGELNVSGQGRTFLPFGGRHAVQAQGEFMHYLGRDEGQMDLGLVSRAGNFQIGGFSSFKYVKFSEWESVGGLGQAAGTLDYIFDRGRVGFFGTKAFLDGAVVNREMLRRNLFEETYLNVVDQVGFSAAVAAWDVGGGRDAWFEGNLGALFRRGGSNRPGGMLRYVHPITGGLALTLEGGLNETLVSNNNTGRFVVGLQFGKWLSPQNYGDQGTKPVPVDVPRVRYEVLTRQVRTGNDLPVADAGPDQVGVEAGPITLDGSGSFDPDGDPLTYEWTQVGGDPVSLSGASSATASFTAEEGKTYNFRLTVRDDQGGTGTDRVTVSAQSNEIRILRFSVDPTRVSRGEEVSIVWQVENADTVNISPQPGDVDLGGTSRVPVNETTVFTLTATKGGNTITEQRTVEVDERAPRVVSFLATPMMIQEGDTSTLSWETEGADDVEVTIQSGPGQPLGSVGTSGTSTVSPPETTTYLLTATNAFGSTSRTATVDVVPQGMPVILNFVATPQEIDPGGFSTLVWEVQNADDVTIDPTIGPVDLAGTSDVNPSETTSYTLTATNDEGSVTATVLVTVRRAVRIVSFTANKPRVQNPGEPAMLSWETENAERVTLLPDLGDVDPNGSMTVNPLGQTVYTLIAYGKNSSVQAIVTVGVENENGAPIAVAEAPVAILVPAGTVFGTGQLTGDKSSDPEGDPITYEWRSLGPLEATIRNPTAANPTVEFRGGYGQYNFELMVMDDKGAMGFDTVRVFWVDP